jgi:HAD superfamily hydrolase (TIGR01549 family)
VTPERHRTPAFLFDLDGTLIDSVYQHVIAWREALEQVGINLAVWKIHRRIGMSGGLFVAALARELDTDLDRETLARLPGLHADAYIEKFNSVRSLPGSAQLLATLTENEVPWAIATSGAERYAHLALDLLGLPADTPMITRDQVRYAKPDPDLFLTAADRIGVDIEDSIVVGDSVWDLLAARRARALGISRADMAVRSCCTRVPSGFTRTPPTSSLTWTRSECAARCSQGLRHAADVVR